MSSQGTKERASEKEEVIVKGLGKAIEKTLGLALFFQGQEDLSVKIRTGSVRVVDDIEEIDDAGENADAEAQGEIPIDESKDAGVVEEVPETQSRFTSMIEVAISLR